MTSKLLVITRNYPPQTGGLENYSFNLIRELGRHMPVQMIALKKTKPHLIWFLPASLIFGLMASRSQSIRGVHLCDGLLAPIGSLLKGFSRTRVSASVHGLDVTFPHAFYQQLVPPSLARLDQIVCVSRSTLDECLKRGISAERCLVIPNGINPKEIYLRAEKGNLLREIETVLQRSLAEKKILVTVGRLVKRKGVGWFVENVVSRLGREYIYVIVGTGPEFSVIQDIVRRNQLEDRVVLTERQPDRFRNCLLNAADAFIMPNISIPGDVEGFGIAALEAGACGLPVVAAGIQGIRDAVIEGITGHLVREGDAERFAAIIESLDMDRSRIRKAVAERFSWERIGMEYAQKLSLL
jgi:glycosyltransferase involved in cell wall biosynthesis